MRQQEAVDMLRAAQQALQGEVALSLMKDQRIRGSDGNRDMLRVVEYLQLQHLSVGGHGIQVLLQGDRIQVRSHDVGFIRNQLRERSLVEHEGQQRLLLLHRGLLQRHQVKPAQALGSG